MMATGRVQSAFRAGRALRHRLWHGADREKVATRWKVSREAQDEFALQSHQHAIAAINNGEFEDEITPFSIVDMCGHGSRTASGKCGRRCRMKVAPDTSLEAVAKLKTVFAQKGSVTGGTVRRCRMGRGGAAVLQRRR